MRHVIQSISGRITETLLLRNAARVAGSHSPEQQESIRRLYRMAANRLAVADDTTDVNYAGAASSLYREAIECLVAALSVSNAPTDHETSFATSTAAETLRDWARTGVIPAPPKRYAELVSSMQIAERPSPDELLSTTSAARRHLLEGFAHWLQSLVEPRSEKEILATRALRCVSVTLVAGALLIWSYGLLFAPKNLALHQPVTMSSRFPSTPDPGGATDGKIIGPFQAHTQVETNPNITVDLSKVRRVGRVIIYNRTDGHYSDTLPLTLELSRDGITFHQVDRRTTVFTSSHPWIFKSSPIETRYVRVHGHESGYVVVTEIQVFER